MAELIAGDGTRFPIADTHVLVGRRSEDGKFRPDIDLADLAGGRTVSRRHLRLSKTDAGWVLRVETTARNATLLGGQPLARHTEAIVGEGAEITLGNVSLVFRGDREPPASDANATLIGASQPGAELHAGERVIPLSAPEGRSLSLGRHSRDLRYRPDIDLNDLPGGTTISRRHAEVYRRGGSWFMRVHADVTNPTYLNGTQLAEGQEARLSDGDELRFGRVVATFHLCQQDQGEQARMLQLQLGPPTDVTLEAGAQQALPLTLVNYSDRVDWFLFEVKGIPSSWYRIQLPNTEPNQPPQVRLLTTKPPKPDPEATARGSLVLMPPRKPEARAGSYPLLVTATSRADDRRRRSVNATLVVLPFVVLQLEAARPELRGSRARYDLKVANAGNAPTSVALSVADDPRLKTRLEAETLPLSNAGQASTGLEVHVKRRPWLGPERTHAVRVTASADGQTATQAVRLTCPPRIPVWLQSLFGRVQSVLKPVLLPLAMLAVALGVAYFVLRPPEVKLAISPPIVGSGAETSLTWQVERAHGPLTLESNAGGEQRLDTDRGSLPLKPTATTEYKLTAKNWFGLAGTASNSVRVVGAPKFTASTETINQPGEAVTLEWETDNATAATLGTSDADAAPVPLKGKTTVYPSGATTYRLTVINDVFNARTVVEKQVGFGKPKITQFDADPQQVYPGDLIKLTWRAPSFAKLTLRGDMDDLLLSGEADVSQHTFFQVRPLHTGRYTLSAVTPGKDPDEAHVDVQVLPLKTPRLQAPSKPISFGESAVLTWQAEGTNGYTTLSIQPDVGQVSGTSVEVRPSRTTDYRLVLTGADGQTVTSDPVTVQVLPAIQRFNVAPATLTDGEPVKIEWQAADADAVSIVRDDGFVVESNAPAAGSTRDRPPAAATSYTIKARNATGESLDNGPNTVFKIKVQPPPTPTPAPTQPPAAPAPPNGATTPNGGPTTPNGGPANNGGTAPPNPPSGPVPLLPPLRQT